MTWIVVVLVLSIAVPWAIVIHRHRQELREWIAYLANVANGGDIEYDD